MPVTFRTSVTPAQGAANPTGSCNVDSSYNNAVYVGALSLLEMAI